MNDETIQDLKQFISVTVSQQISGLELKFDSLERNLRQDMRSLEDRLSSQINELSQSVADAMDSTNAVVDDQLKNHEKRITKLESRAA